MMNASSNIQRWHNPYHHSHHLSQIHSPIQISSTNFFISTSESGLIHLDDPGISKFIISSHTPRPCFIVFFEATKIHRKTELRLKEFRRDLISASFLEFSQSQSLLRPMQTNSLSVTPRPSIAEMVGDIMTLVFSHKA
ncbi:hypothetical protein HID58_073899 [Brassica napus]|uniref:Uncharacterized protein n=1 Tax=Brassica napus TaxID=3708 RepID=A0ABQ7YGZ2_BRANA|nr:hypothetical protein HID58_073899 [Brassica napus]